MEENYKLLQAWKKNVDLEESQIRNRIQRFPQVFTFFYAVKCFVMLSSWELEVSWAMGFQRLCLCLTYFELYILPRTSLNKWMSGVVNCSRSTSHPKDLRSSTMRLCPMLGPHLINEIIKAMKSIFKPSPNDNLLCYLLERKPGGMGG